MVQFSQIFLIFGRMVHDLIYTKSSNLHGVTFYKLHKKLDICLKITGRYISSYQILSEFIFEITEILRLFQRYVRAWRYC